LARLLDALAADTDGAPRRIVIVDDRPRTAPWEVGIPAGIAAITRVIRSGGRGPAAARNLGWRACASEWIVFLGDDVIPAAGWAAKLGEDLDAPTEVVGVQARIEVPLPSDRSPTDWERNVRGLQHARWITADMAYRRWALELLGGFDERF